MKQAMTLLLTFLFCCSLLSCNINRRFIVVENEEPEKTLTVSSAKELVDFLNGYLFLDRETGETPPQYLLGKDFSFDVLYTKFNAQTDLDGLSFYGEILPYGFRFVHKGNSLYSRYISTCYGYYNSPTCAFRQTETSEYYRDFASLTSFCSILHEEQRFRTYGDFDETQITYDQKTKYTYSNEKEYLSDTSNVEGGDVRGFILQYLFVDLFHTPEPYEGTLWQTVKHLRFSEENFSSVGNLVTFSLSYPTESANVKLSGVLDLKSFDLLLSVEQIYTDPSLSPRECAYTVSLKTHDVEDIIFDTSRDFTESIDVKSR